VRLDDREQRAQLQELKARKDFANREVARVTEFIGRGSATTQAHERVSTDLRTIQALVSVPMEKLDIAIMKSLGLRQTTVRRIFVVEALLIGSIGALAAARAPTTCPPPSGSKSTRTSGPTKSRAASASASRSPVRSPTRRRSSLPTSRPARSIRSRASRCSRSSATWIDRHAKTVVAVTHDLALAGRMDRRIQLADGGIVADDGGIIG